MKLCVKLNSTKIILALVYSFKGGDSNFEVNIFTNSGSCYNAYKWAIYLALTNMYVHIAWTL